MDYSNHDHFQLTGKKLKDFALRFDFIFRRQITDKLPRALECWLSCGT